MATSRSCLRPPSRCGEPAPACGPTRYGAAPQPLPAVFRHTRSRTESHRAAPVRALDSCLRAVAFLFPDALAGLEIRRCDDAVSVFVYGGKHRVARHRLLETCQIVDLTRLPGVSDDLVECPSLGHPVQDGFNPALRFAHFVRRNCYHGVEAGFFLFPANRLANAIETLGQRLGLFWSQRQHEVPVADLMISGRTGKSLQRARPLSRCG